MFQPYELFIGLRYTRAKRRNNFISFISLISIFGIAIGVWALITIISVMNGFESELRNRILGMASHATISDYSGALQNWDTVLEQVKTHEDVLGAAPYVEGQLMLSSSGKVSGAISRGILPQYESEVADVEDKMIAGRIGSLQAGKWNVILGKELAYSLRLSLGDKVTVITPSNQYYGRWVHPEIEDFYGKWDF